MQNSYDLDSLIYQRLDDAKLSELIKLKEVDEIAKFSDKLDELNARIDKIDTTPTVLRQDA